MPGVLLLLTPDAGCPLAPAAEVPLEQLGGGAEVGVGVPDWGIGVPLPAIVPLCSLACVETSL